MSSTPVWAGQSSSPLEVAPLLGAGAAASGAAALLLSAASAVAAALCQRSLAGGVGLAGAAAVAGLAAGAVAATCSGARRRAAGRAAGGRGSCTNPRASRWAAAGLLLGASRRMAALLQEAAMEAMPRSSVCGCRGCEARGGRVPQLGAAGVHVTQEPLVRRTIGMGGDFGMRTSERPGGAQITAPPPPPPSWQMRRLCSGPASTMYTQDVGYDGPRRHVATHRCSKPLSVPSPAGCSAPRQAAERVRQPQPLPRERPAAWQGCPLQHGCLCCRNRRGTIGGQACARLLGAWLDATLKQASKCMRWVGGRVG